MKNGTASIVREACADIGRKLEQNKIVQMAENAALQHPHNKLHITFLTLHLKGALEAVKEAFDIRVLPENIRIQDINSSVDIQISEGKDDVIQDMDRLIEDTNEPIVLQLYRTNSFLGEINIEIISSQAGFTDFDWREKLAKTDYVFLITSATCLLTAVEREFITLYIQNYLGAPRFAILLSDGMMISSSEDYTALRDRVDWCLKSIGRDGRFFEIGTGELRTFIHEELITEKQKLSELAELQSARICLRETKEALDELAEQTTLDADEIEQVICSLRSHQEQMIRRGKLAADRARSEIKGTIQYSCYKAIDQYTASLESNIVETLHKTEDINYAGRMLPRFLETAGRECIGQLQKLMKEELKRLGERLTEVMKNDAGEFFEENINGGVTEPAPIPQKEIQWKIQIDKDASNTKKKLNFYSKAMLAVAIPAIVLGYVPLAVGTAVGSQLVKKLSREKIEAENREAMIRQVHSLCQIINKEVQEECSRSINVLAEEAGNAVEEEYKSFVNLVLNRLAELKEKAVWAGQRRSLILQIQKEELPKLEEMFG